MEKLSISFATPEGDAAGKLIMSKPADGNGAPRPASGRRASMRACALMIGRAGARVCGVHRRRARSPSPRSLLSAAVDPDAATLDAFSTMYADAGVNEAIERAPRPAAPRDAPPVARP